MTSQNKKNAIHVSKLIPPKTTPSTKTKKFIDDFVFNPLGNVIVDSDTSCNLEDAVAKMLGWLREPLRIHPDEINIHKFTLGQMPYLPKLYYSLDDHLAILIENAADNLKAADNDSDTSEEIKSKTIGAFLDCEDLIKKAVAYKSAINTELAKEKKSALKIDIQQTNNLNETYITLDSLCDWAKANYGISIREEFALAKLPTIPAFKEPQRTNDLREEIIEILSTMQNPRPAKVMTALKARIGVVQGTCVVGDIGYGIKWSDGITEHEFDMKALRQRIRNLKKL